MMRQPTPNAVNLRRAWRVIAIAAAVIAVGAALALAFETVSHTPPPTTTTTSTTTSTTIPSPSHALTAFINDVVAGQTAKLIGPQVGQSLSMGAQQAVIDAGNGNADLAATDLQQVATTIANGVSSGYISKASGNDVDDVDDLHRTGERERERFWARELISVGCAQDGAARSLGGRTWQSRWWRHFIHEHLPRRTRHRGRD
jgi:hypothetical protein